MRLFLSSLLLNLPLLASSSAFDIAKFVQYPAANYGSSFVSDGSGNLYILGTTSSPSTFPVTKGALSAPISPFGSMLFLQKLSPDGSQVLASALLSGVQSYLEPRLQMDSAGNLYVAFVLQGTPAGVTQWKGDPNGSTAVLEVAPGLDRVLSASRQFGNPASMALDSDGSVYTANGPGISLNVFKLDPTGVLSTFTTLTETNGYQSAAVVAIGPGHTLWVAAAPSFVYRLDLTSNSAAARAVLPGSPLTISSLSVDGAGTAYVGGYTVRGYAFQANAMDYAAALPGGSRRGFIFKVDSTGSVANSSLFDENITALSADASGRVWAAGFSQAGITLFQLNAAGTAFLHYVSLTAVTQFITSSFNQVTNISTDSTGRALVAGFTAAPALPSFGTWDKYITTDPNAYQSAFFFRTASNPPQADLRLDVTASPASTVPFGVITYSVHIANRGPAPANDVLLKLPDFDNGSQVSASYIENCHSSVGVTGCPLHFAQIASGASIDAQLTYSVPSPSPPVISFPFAIRSSTDDANQTDNVAAPPVNLGPSGFSVTIDDGANAQGAVWILASVNDLGVRQIGCISGFGCLGVPVTGDMPARIYVVTPQGILQGGMYEFAGWKDGSSDNPRTFAPGQTTVGIKMRAITRPWVNPDAPLVQAANYRGGAIAPGEVVTLAGVNLGPSKLITAQLDDQGHVATNLAGFQVSFDGTPAPVVYTSATQAAVIVPYEVAGKQSVSMVIQYQQAVSSAVTILVTDTAPGLFSANSSGSGELAAFNSNATLNTRSNPAARGDIVTIFATGEGLTNPVPADGQIAGSAPPKPQMPVSVSVGGLPAEVLYQGGVPGVTAGVMQINLRVPAGVQPGLLPVRVVVGSAASQRGGTLAIQ